jgi:opacity protein-like surface antigen
MMMRRILAGAVLFLGSMSAVHAQQVAGATGGLQPLQAAANMISTSSAAPFVSVSSIPDAGNLLDADFSAPSTALAPGAFLGDPASAAPVPVPSPALPGDPAPAPDPRFIYGSRDDYRWQLGLGASWERFRSTIFNASAVGVNTSISYYLNDWLGVEGNVMTGFAPEIFEREHVKLLNFTGGPRIAWRQRRWEPWAHVLIGVSHEQPQTAASSRNAFAVQAGGGADYRINPRLSLRLEGDWLRTLFFSQSQNNFTLMGGFVIHF